MLRIHEQIESIKISILNLLTSLICYKLISWLLFNHVNEYIIFFGKYGLIVTLDEQNIASNYG